MNFEEFLNESKITLKRKYTENHPAKTVGKHASIRNTIIEAVKDGKMTKEEFNNILSKVSEDQKRWLKRNAAFFNVSEDGISLSKDGLKIYNQIKQEKENQNKPRFEMKRLVESFSDFIENLNENEELVAEALKSSILANLLTLGNGSKWGKQNNSEIIKYLYAKAKLKFDEIEDADIITMDPRDAYKSKPATDQIIFYVTQNEKENPFFPNDGGDNYAVIPANTLLAVANGNNDFYGVKWQGGVGRFGRGGYKGISNVGRKENDADLGINKRRSGYDSSGLTSIDRISKIADVAYVIDVTALRQRFSTEAERIARAEARKGATALIDPKAFKDANMAKYKSILAQRVMNDDIDGKVESAIATCSDLLQKALRAKEYTQYDELKIGQDPRGREITMRDVTNFMSNLLDDYSNYTRYKNQAKQEAESGRTTGYYEKEAKTRALYIKERLAKLDKMNIAW